MNSRLKKLYPYIISIAILSGMGTYLVVRGQQKTFIPSELEASQLKSIKLEAVIAFRDFNTAQQNWNQKLSDLRAKCEEIKKNHNWPDDIVCDVNKEPITFRYKTDEEKREEVNAKAKETQEKMIKEELEKREKVQQELEKKQQESNPASTNK